MRLWRVILLVNLALAVGLLLGYLAWGRESIRLERELERARQGALAPGVERTWTIRGVVRAVLPESNVIILTHEDIPGYMDAMTMGFRLHEPQLMQGLDIGETYRFTLKGVPPEVAITAITRDARP